MPGDIYTYLLLGVAKIPDPYYRDNNEKVQWVAEKTWVYERTFELSADLLEKEHIEIGSLRPGYPGDSRYDQWPEGRIR